MLADTPRSGATMAPAKVPFSVPWRYVIPVLIGIVLWFIPPPKASRPQWLPDAVRQRIRAGDVRRRLREAGEVVEGWLHH